jgi:hypothetical protein
MTKKFVFRARVDEFHQKKLNTLMEATGYSNQSELLRALVESASLISHPSLNVTLNANSDAIRQDAVAAAA